jgi:hypothetical protein
MGEPRESSGKELRHVTAFDFRRLTTDDLSCMMGVLPNCYRLTVSEPDNAGNIDYIINQGDIDLPSSEELLRLAAPEANSKKLQLRQLAFHSALLRLVDKKQAAVSQQTPVDYEVPRHPVESIASLQKKQQVKLVGTDLPSSSRTASFSASTLRLLAWSAAKTRAASKRT